MVGHLRLVERDCICSLLCRAATRRIAADTRLGLKDKLISAVRKDTPPGLEDYPKGERRRLPFSTVTSYHVAALGRHRP